MDNLFGATSGMPCHPNDLQWYSAHDIDCKVENGYAITYCKRCGVIIQTVWVGERREEECDGRS